MARVYDLPLVDWISIGLYKKTLDEALKKIKKNEPLDVNLCNNKNNQKYIEKVLREEIFKQFSDYRRPMMEIILNSVDARHDNLDKDYIIDILLRKKKFRVKDNGRGMSLEDILKFLIIPFSTEKTGLEEIGRFGVGFLSTFNYCLNEPDSTKVYVDTSTGKENYHIEFYGQGKEVADLRMRLKMKGLKKPGTKVVIKRKISSLDDLSSYFTENLSVLPTYKARILQNRKPVNPDFGAKWYSDAAELDVLGKKVKQQVGFRKKDQKEIYLTSQGVLVKSLKTNSSGSTVSFPPAVQVVEGRDEFKIDKNYNICIEAYFRAFEKYLKDGEKNKKFTLEMLDFIPSLMSAFEIKSIKDIPNIENIRAVLLPKKKYALTSTQFIILEPFLGNKLREFAFEASNQSCAYWREVYGSEDDVHKDMIKIKQKMCSHHLREKIKKDNSFLQNLHLVAKEITPKQDQNKGGWFYKNAKNPYGFVALVDGPDNTNNPFFVAGSTLYINFNHRNVAGPLNPAKVYSNLSDYFTVYEVVTKNKMSNIDQHSLEEHVRFLTENLHPNIPEKVPEKEESKVIVEADKK